jgi:predicted transcriptional regulator
MEKVRHTVDLDVETEARLKSLAEERGQAEGEVIADALELLHANDADGPDIEEDLRRLEEFNRTQMGVPLDEVKAWVRSWGTENELPPPKPRKLA